MHVVLCAHLFLPQLIETQIQAFGELAVRVSEEVWDLFCIMSHI